MEKERYSIQPTISHRLGKPGDRQTPGVLVNFTSYRARERLMKQPT